MENDWTTTDEGYRRLRKDMFDPAMESFEVAIRSNDHDAAALAGAGACCLALNRVGDAVLYIDRACAVSPKFTYALDLRVAAYVTAGRYHDAVRAGRAAIFNSAAGKSVHYNLGVALAKIGRTRGGLRHLEAAIRIDPTYQPALAVLARQYLDLRQFDRAVPVLRRLVSIDPADRAARVGLAHALSMSAAHIRLRRRHEANRLFAESFLEYANAYELDTSDLDVLKECARAAMWSSKLAKSQTLFQELIAARPADADAHLLLADAFWRDRNLAGARSEIERALSIDPRIRFGRQSLAKCLFWTGDLKGAVVQIVRGIAGV